MVKYWPLPLQILNCLHAKPRNQRINPLAALNIKDDNSKNELNKLRSELAALKQKIENTKCDNSSSSMIF